MAYEDKDNPLTNRNYSDRRARMYKIYEPGKKPRIQNTKTACYYCGMQHEWQHNQEYIRRYKGQS